MVAFLAEMDPDSDRRLARVKKEIDQLPSPARALAKGGRRRSRPAAPCRGHGPRARPPSTFRRPRPRPWARLQTFARPPAPAFARDASWQDAFDDLRQRKRRRGERPNQWRRDTPLRRIAFEPPILPDDRDADHVVQVHLEHRLVRRLLGRFLSQGFQSGLNRVTVIAGPGAQPRIVLIGRIALYGPGAAGLPKGCCRSPPSGAKRTVG